MKIVSTDAYDHPYDNPLLADDLKYRPDVLALDKIAYEDFRNSLTTDEATLLELMIETQNTGKKGGAGFKKQFISQTGSTYSHYEAIHMSLMRKYYHHYGTPEQQKDFETFYRTWRPRTPMYHGRG